MANQVGTASIPGAFSASKYYHTAVAATPLIKTGAGFLGSIIMNTPVASGTITVYDGIDNTGAVIAIITNPGTLVAEGPVGAFYGIGFMTGLYIVITGTQDITVSWL
jgi:hypothetical protein